MAAHPPIKDQVALEVLRKLGEEGLVSIGSLLRSWEEKNVGDRSSGTPSTAPKASPKSKKVKPVPQPECLHDQKFVDSTRLELALASDEIKNMGKEIKNMEAEIKALKKNLGSSRDESRDLKKDLESARKSLEESVETMKKMKEEVDETRDDMDSMLKVNKDIYEKLESIENERTDSCFGKRSMCSEPDWFSKKIKMVDEMDPVDFEEV